MPRLVTALAFVAAIAWTAHAPADAGERLTAQQLVPAPVFDAGDGVPDPASWFATDHPAVTYRNMEELFPTRRVAAGPVPSPLTPAAAPFDVHYRLGNATYSIADFVARNDTTGLLILKGEQILYEGYYQGADPYDLFMSFSAGKSFVSTLVGLAVGDGKIHSIDDPVIRYLPEVKGSAYEAATVKQVLQMASGTSFTEEYENERSDIVQFVTAFLRGTGLYEFARSFKAARRPGTQFHYASADTEVLGALVARATGHSLSSYLSDKIWRPIGAEAPARWTLDRPGGGGREAASGGLQVRLRDYGRFGLLIANDGVWHGRRLLPPGWVAAATRPQDPYVDFGKLEAGSPLGYGYQWWCVPGPSHAFTAWGIHGQFIYVDPESKLVVVALSAWQHADDEAKIEETFTFFAAVSDAVR